jgi:hypothetical protein
MQMSDKNRYLTLIIAALTAMAICLASPRTSAQQPGAQNQRVFISDDDFVSLNQQIKELKNPTFRAFLRMRVLSWYGAETNATRRQAAIQVAAQGLKDLCDHQEEVWSPTATWLHGSLVKQIKSLNDKEEASIDICTLKAEANKPASDLSSALKMLSNADTTPGGLAMAKTAIASGQTSPEALLGHLLQLRAASSPHLSELLVAVVALEEQRPGSLTIRMMPFFSSLFLDQSVAPEVLTRFMAVALRASRLSAEELAKVEVRGSVYSLLNGLIGPARRVAPALYPEIASLLSSLNRGTPNAAEARLAADERIQKASDQLNRRSRKQTRHPRNS